VRKRAKAERENRYARGGKTTSNRKKSRELSNRRGSCPGRTRKNLREKIASQLGKIKDQKEKNREVATTKTLLGSLQGSVPKKRVATGGKLGKCPGKGGGDNREWGNHQPESTHGNGWNRPQRKETLVADERNREEATKEIVFSGNGGL